MGCRYDRVRIEHAVGSPEVLAVVDVLPLAGAFGYLAPLRPVVEPPEDAVERRVVVVPTPRALATDGQKVPDQGKLSGGQFVAASYAAEPTTCKNNPSEIT